MLPVEEHNDLQELLPGALRAFWPRDRTKSTEYEGGGAHEETYGLRVAL